MVTVNEITAKTAEQSYKRLQEILYCAEQNIPQVVLFYSPPEPNSSSGELQWWCRGCKRAHDNFMEVAKSYTGKAKLHTVSVGSRKEYVMSENNPFEVYDPTKKGVQPRISLVPTMVGYIIYKEEGGIEIHEILRKVCPTSDDMNHDIKAFLAGWVSE